MNPQRPRRVVYTALVGQYEMLNEQPMARESDIEFVCFTDDPGLTSESWSIRLIEPRFPLDQVRSARFLKTRGARLLGDYDESLWIDNSVVLKRVPEDLLDEWLAGADLAIPLHSFRTSVLGEFDAVATEGYDDPARVYEQLIHYQTLRPEVLTARPYWTALIARRHGEAVDEVTQLWNDHILRYSRRDQLSINFVIESVGLTVAAIDIDNLGSQWHEWPVRNAKKWNITQDRMAAALRPPTAEVGRLQNEVDALRADLDSRLEAFQRLEQREQDHKQREQDHKQREHDLEAEVAALPDQEKLHAHYKNSASWRVTAPLRAASRILKRR